MYHLPYNQNLKEPVGGVILFDTIFKARRAGILIETGSIFFIQSSIGAASKYTAPIGL